MQFILDSLEATIERLQQQQHQQDQQDEFPELGDDRDGSLPPPNDLGLGMDPPADGEENAVDPGPTVTVGQRRPRSDSTSTPAQRKAKYARFVEDVCNVYQLRGAKHAEVQDFSALNSTEQNIVVFSVVQGLRQDLAHRDAKTFHMSTQSKDHSNLMLRVLLLAPTNKSYVCADVLKFVKADIRNHYNDWTLLKSTIDDHNAAKELVKSFGRKLTTDRNAIKEVLNLAVENNYCINQLMNELTCDEIYVTEQHRTRWAWVLKFYKEHQKAVLQKRCKDNAFWQDLDKALRAQEDALLEKVQDADLRAAVREQTFTHDLNVHRQNYPTRVAARTTPEDAANWQIALEARLARRHNYVV